MNTGAQALKKMRRVAADIPWGGWLKEAGQEGIREIVKAGCDFVVFPAANTSLTIVEDDEVGKILQVEPSLGDGLLRTVNELPIDAVLVSREGEGDYSLTWHHLMIFQHFADSLTKRLLVSVPSNVTADELQALWEAGVVGVVIEVEKSEGGLNKLRQAVDKLTFSPQRKHRKSAALLPYTSRGTETATEEEEELE